MNVKFFNEDLVLKSMIILVLCGIGFFGVIYLKLIFGFNCSGLVLLKLVMCDKIGVMILWFFEYEESGWVSGIVFFVGNW